MDAFVSRTSKIIACLAFFLAADAFAELPRVVLTQPDLSGEMDTLSRKMNAVVFRRQFHWTTDYSFASVYTVKREGANIGKMNVHGAGFKSQCDFAPADGEMVEAEAFRLAVWDAFTASGIYSPREQRFLARRMDQACLAVYGTAELPVLAGGHILLDQNGGLAVVSADGLTIQRDSGGGPDRVRTRTTLIRHIALGRYFVDSLKCETSGKNERSILDAKFKYAEKEHLPYVQELDVQSTIEAEGKRTTIHCLLANEKQEFPHLLRGAYEAGVLARGLMAAYHDRDFWDLAWASAPADRAAIVEIGRQGEKHPRYNSLFGPDSASWKAVQQRTSDDVRVGFISARNAWAEIGKGDGADELVVFVLAMLKDGQGENWFFQDIRNVSRQEFEKLPVTAPAADK